MIKILKKNGEIQNFNGEKIKRAIRKSAERVCVTLSEKEEKKVVDTVRKQLQYNTVEIPVATIHNMVETELDNINQPRVAKSYRDYRDSKSQFSSMLDKVYSKKLSLAFVGDRSNANSDSALVTTQKAIVYNELNSELYKKFFLTQREERAMSDGYIYVHDRGSRLDTINCFTRDTKFITDNGIKSFNDFNDGDTVNVISHKGVWRKATIHNYGKTTGFNKITFKRGSNSKKIVYATSNHRWILKDGSVTTNLKIGDKLIHTPSISKFEWDDLTSEQKKIWVYGFCMADGATAQNSENSWYSYIRLFGHKVEYKHYFEDAGFTVTPFKYDTVSYSVYIPGFRKDTFTGNTFTTFDIKVFTHGYLCADGHRNLIGKCNSEWRGVQSTGINNTFLESFLNVSGYYVTRKYDITNNSTNFGERSDITIEYGFYSESGFRTWNVENIEYDVIVDGDMWCLDVEEDHSFLLECGIPTGNCCVYDMKNLITGGFFMGNLDYQEPKTLDVAFDLIGDVTLNAASSQYGGFTIPQIDKLLAPYAEKSYKKYYDEYMSISMAQYDDWDEVCEDESMFERIKDSADEYATNKVRRDFEQGFQSWEMKFNSVASSRGDYPFTAITFGLGTGKFETMCSSACMKVRKEGQGKPGFKHPVLFPKINMFYDENLHGEGKELEWLFDEAIECSSKAMYPDFISLTGDGYDGEMYKKYKTPISKMGCRANLSPWYVRGGMEPADENDYPVFEGRFNMGAISLHFPMIVAKAKKEDKDFFEVLDYYLEMARGIHRRTFEFLSHKKAGINPLGFCQGGFLNGNLDPEQEIGEDFLRPMTISFGITALNEASILAIGKTLVQDNSWAISVLQHINDYVNRIKKEDNILYAIYSTPAESLCHLAVQQFKKKYGIIKNVSDHEYMSNSFHCCVREDITPIQKQDIEYPMYHLSPGGRIQYVKYHLPYNLEAIKILVRRAMKMGFYEGINFDLNFCEECGHTFTGEKNKCEKCGSEKITSIRRMNGYLSYSKIRGGTMYADHKLTEFKERVSM